MARVSEKAVKSYAAWNSMSEEKESRLLTTKTWVS